MYIEEDDYEKFKLEDINLLKNLNYNFSLNQRFVNVKNSKGNYFTCQTPFLKILKPVHVTLNKKKTIAKKYIILETSDDLDFNNQIGDFLFIVNKIHEISQEKIKENSIDWFNTEFDDIGLDIKVKRPIEQQKDSEFIRICIPNNKEIEDEINLLSKGDYILCNIIFKGLKISNDYITEEWEITDLITQEKYDMLQKSNILYEDITKISTLLEEEYLENKLLENTINNIEQNNETNNIIYDNEINNLLDNSNIEGNNETNYLLDNNIENNNEINNLLDNSNIINNNEINNLLDNSNIENNNEINNLLDNSNIENNNEINNLLDNSDIENNNEINNLLDNSKIEKKNKVKKELILVENNIKNIKIKKNINEKIIENKIKRNSQKKQEIIKKSKKIIFT
jgi:hypothetical protein